MDGSGSRAAFSKCRPHQKKMSGEWDSLRLLTSASFNLNWLWGPSYETVLLEKFKLYVENITMLRRVRPCTLSHFYRSLIYFRCHKSTYLKLDKNQEKKQPLDNDPCENFEVADFWTSVCILVNSSVTCSSPLLSLVVTLGNAVVSLPWLTEEIQPIFCRISRFFMSENITFSAKCELISIKWGNLTHSLRVIRSWRFAPQ